MRLRHVQTVLAIAGSGLDPLRGVKARQVAVGVDQAAPANGSGARPAAVPKNLKRRRSDSAECCEAVRRCRFSRDQVGSQIFGDEIGRSEPDGRVLQAEAGGPSRHGSWSRSGPARRSPWRGCGTGLATEASRRSGAFEIHMGRHRRRCCVRSESGRNLKPASSMPSTAGCDGKRRKKHR